MKRRLFHIEIIGLLLSICSGLCSCIYDDGSVPDEPYPVPPDLQVSFCLVMQHTEPQVATASRGVTPIDENNGKWSDEYDKSDAISFESQLLKDCFYVTFYNVADNAYLGKLDYVICTDLRQSNDGDIYEFRGVLTLQDESITVEALRAMTVKMMITANTYGLSETAFISLSSDINDGPGAFIFSKIGQKYDFDAIPMWGVNHKNMAGIQQGNAYDMGEISLLRAMAKVEVYVNPAIAQEQDVKIQSVTISRTNTSGYVLPGRWNTLTETTGLKFLETLRIPSDVNSIIERAFGTVENGGIIFYLPECTNTINDEIVLTVDYTVGTDSRVGQIYFRPYDENGKPSDAPLWDIVRNHHYRYEIAGVDMTTSELIIKSIRIEDWFDDGGGILTPVQ